MGWIRGGGDLTFVEYNGVFFS